MKSGFVSILGRPNAGKSTLLNALLGQKLAIVTSKPQTTRTSIQGVVTTADYQIVFADTPGIHRSNTLMNKRMMDTVRASASADVVLFLIDVLEHFREEDAEAIDLVKKLKAPAFAVLNKVDKLQDKSKLLALIEHLRTLHEFAEFIPISATKGTGIGAPKAHVWSPTVV
jgi:GTP-binding protein Era